LQENGIYGVHPDRGIEEVIDHVKLFVDLDESETGGLQGSRALTLCPGSAYDRSPCGTGTSAKLAVLCAKGDLALGEPFVSESVIGTRFLASAVRTAKVGPYEAIIPEVEGSAWITAFQNFVIDPDDPCRFGFA
jgi:proline racemase